jgi:hypothetical protein
VEEVAGHLAAERIPVSRRRRSISGAISSTLSTATASTDSTGLASVRGDCKDKKNHKFNNSMKKIND